MESIFGFTIMLAVGFVIYSILYPKDTKETLDDLKRGHQHLKSTTTYKNSESYISTNYRKVKKYAQLKISKSYLTGCTWMLVNENDDSIQFNFFDNGELIVTTDGNVKRGNYQLIVDNNSILITREGNTEHFNIVNVQDDFLFLNKMSTNLNLTFANYTKYKDELKSVLKDHAKEYSKLI